MQKKKFPYFFLITCLQTHHLRSKKFNFLQKNFLLKFYFAGNIGEKGRIRKAQKLADPDPQHFLLLWLFYSPFISGHLLIYKQSTFMLICESRVPIPPNDFQVDEIKSLRRQEHKTQAQQYSQEHK
jgi:hypothetical protein